MKFNYRKICSSLLKDLPQREKEIILRRFGLETGKRETLELIGRDLGITRERVRQIQEGGFLKLKPKLKKNKDVFKYFIKQLETSGNFKKEEILLSQLGENKYQPQVFFLLTLGEPFKRFSETKEFYSLWTINTNSLLLAKKFIDFSCHKLKEAGKLLTFKELNSSFNKERQAPSFYFGLSSYEKDITKRQERFFSSALEISKIIQKNQEGLFGLKNWPEINPRRIKDKAYLVFKKAQTPLHFTEVTKLISPDALSQTVHNELIRDSRFVLVGRGIYALKEWGYEEGQVKDIIMKVLKEAKKPLLKEEILEKVLKQRLVKENTILLNLNNKKYFLKTPEGKYTFQES